jgi:hypothetical protein
MWSPASMAKGAMSGSGVIEFTTGSTKKKWGRRPHNAVSRSAAVFYNNLGGRMGYDLTYGLMAISPYVIFRFSRACP